jgi:hypothetical protein
VLFSRITMRLRRKQLGSAHPGRCLHVSCVICGHEQLRDGPGRLTCPTCGAALTITQPHGNPEAGQHVRARPPKQEEESREAV